MAVLKHRLRRKTTGGDYDVVHLETDTDMVLMGDGTKLTDTITSLLASVGSGGNSGVVGGSDYSDIITGSIALGSVVTMADTEWIVVHFDADNHIFYMMTVDIVSKTVFGENNKYLGSTLANVAKAYEDNLPVAVKNKLVTLNINGVTGKVIVASKEQMTSGFSYMNCDANRIAKYNGIAAPYWASSPYSSGATGVDEHGQSNVSVGVSTIWGFRPCVALSISNSSDSLPSGSIIIWSGAADAIPDGWLLCNGSNGTPDLRDRFVLGAGVNHTVGATGGEENHTLTISEMPRHYHTLEQSLQWVSGSHLNFGSQLPGMVELDKNYAKGLDSTTKYSGSSAAHNNMPPYYTLCYIMKL